MYILAACVSRCMMYGVCPLIVVGDRRGDCSVACFHMCSKTMVCGNGVRRVLACVCVKVEGV